MALKRLFWLRWRLTLRGFTRNKSSLVGSIIGLVVLGPYALALAGGLGYGLVKLDLTLGENALRAALLLLAGIWVVGPLLGFQPNEAQDITRLFVYPVPVRTLFLGAILGCFLELTTLFLLPTLLATVVGAAFHGVGAALVAVPAVSFFLFQTLAASQAVTLALQGVLRSRKWRDVVLLVVPLFWITWQVGVQALSRDAVKTDWRAFLTSPLWEGLSLLPSGLAARAVAAGMKGLWPLAIAYLGALGLVTVATLSLSGWLVGKAYQGEAVGVPAPTASRNKAQGSTRRRLGRARGILGAIVQKEWAIFTRDPYFRLLAMNYLTMLVIGAFSALSRGQGSEGVGSTIALWLATSLGLVQQTRLSYNIFGAEANAAGLLFAYPLRRRVLLLGKNLANLSAILPLNLLATLGLCAALHRTDMLVVLVPWMLCASVVMTAVGNAVSVMLPQRVNPNGLRTRGASGGEGFLLLGITLAALVLYIPVLAAVLVPTLWIESTWLWLTVPLALGYTGGLYALSLRLTEDWLLEREPEIIAKVARPES